MPNSQLASKIGEKIKAIRERHGFTQQTVATYLNISRSYYTSKELGRSLPTVDQLLRLATLYNVCILDFVSFHPSSLKFYNESNDDETEAILTLFEKLEDLRTENNGLREENRELKFQLSLISEKKIKIPQPNIKISGKE
ncbi:MAG: helix-turn-helix transcriptional regulator [Desulfobacteraceae bacterium]|jgi:transcriptional regulator with XRE-family HTH domain